LQSYACGDFEMSLLGVKWKGDAIDHLFERSRDHRMVMGLDLVLVSRTIER